MRSQFDHLCATLRFSTTYKTETSIYSDDRPWSLEYVPYKTWEEKFHMVAWDKLRTFDLSQFIEYIMEGSVATQF